MSDDMGLIALQIKFLSHVIAGRQRVMTGRGINGTNQVNTAAKLMQEFCKELPDDDNLTDIDGKILLLKKTADFAALHLADVEHYIGDYKS